MTPEEVEKLIQLVARMRTAQKAYFRSKNSAVLSQSKELERQVDRVLEEYMNKQARMF